MKKVLLKIKQILKRMVLALKEEKVVPIAVPTDKDKMLEGKIALITGGSSGIGYSMAEEFIKSGAKVIIAGTNEEKLANCVAKLGKENARGIVIDVREVKKLSEKVNEAVQLFEENRIDILVNSAGVITKNNFMNMTESEYDDVMNINAKGTYFMSQAVAKLMIEKNIKGHILNLSSASALRPAWTPYQMSKWAVRGLTLGLADELLPHGIVVNAIAPGPTATPMLSKNENETIYNSSNPSKRYAMPSEIASLAVYMVSGLGDLIVGDTFYITGGAGTITLHN